MFWGHEEVHQPRCSRGREPCARAHQFDGLVKLFLDMDATLTHRGLRRTPSCRRSDWLPVPWQEFGNAPRRMISNAGEKVGEIVLWVETVELGALDQGVDRSGAVAAGIGAGKQIILAANGNRPVILPISGRRSRSIIAGTHSMRAAFAANMSSGAPAAMSFMSR